ncbi:UNVERIFIED_CONTAM: hypothetical protein HDU68_006646 [Siphonaria sp. JEL0065]|nr:hypothetical protein HDU68_006646 [Siphonaria sp. JEL0065]
MNLVHKPRLREVAAVLLGLLLMLFTFNALQQNRITNASKQLALNTMGAKDIVETGIASNKVIVFSKSYCPYCIKAKRLLQKYNVTFEVLELDQREDGDDIQAYLAQKTGQRTVPNIFIGGNQIGGCDAIHALDAQGKLKPLL